MHFLIPAKIPFSGIKNALNYRFRACKIHIQVCKFLLSSRLYCRSWNFTMSAAEAGRGLYRRLGISPSPEESILSTKVIITRYKCDFKGFLEFFIMIQFYVFSYKYRSICRKFVVKQIVIPL